MYLLPVDCYILFLNFCCSRCSRDYATASVCCRHLFFCCTMAMPTPMLLLLSSDTPPVDCCFFFKICHCFAVQCSCWWCCCCSCRRHLSQCPISSRIASWYCLEFHSRRLIVASFLVCCCGRCRRFFCRRLPSAYHPNWCYLLLKMQLSLCACIALLPSAKLAACLALYVETFTG